MVPRPSDFDVCERYKKKIEDLNAQIKWTQESPRGIDGKLTPQQEKDIQRLRRAIEDLQFLMDEEGCIREIPDMPPRPWLKNLAIAHDFEMTQAIQYSDITHQTSNRGRNNEVPLIAKKTTILRVYVYARHIRGSTPTRVTGELQYSRIDKDRYIRYLSPINGPLRVDEDRTGIGIPFDDINFDNTDRGNSNHTLNFAIPADHCSGSMKFTVTIFDPDHKSEVYNNSEPVTRYHTFTNIGEMMIHAVLVRYEELDEQDKVVNIFDPPSEHDLMDLLSRFAKKNLSYCWFWIFPTWHRNYNN